MDAITEKLPENAEPDPKIDAQLDDVAKKNGFAGYDEYNTVVDNISLVLGGFDPATKKYVGTEAVIKAQIAQVQADKKMPAKDKKEALADLNEALKRRRRRSRTRATSTSSPSITTSWPTRSVTIRNKTPIERINEKSPGEISGAFSF